MDEIQFTSCTTMTNLKVVFRMAEGTTAPRRYNDPIYCVLLPHGARDYQGFLSKNGVVLIYDDVPPQYLKIVDQLPAIASNILRP